MDTLIRPTAATFATAVLFVWAGDASAQPPDASDAPDFNRPITIVGEVVRGTVTSVGADGALEIEIAERRLQVRLLSISTPTSSEEGASEALAFLTRLIDDEVSVDLRHQGHTGIWHGIVLWAGQDVGESLVLAGRARYCPGRAHLPYLERAERSARSVGRGIWSRSSAPPCPPSKPHQR